MQIGRWAGQDKSELYKGRAADSMKRYSARKQAETRDRNEKIVRLFSVEKLDVHTIARRLNVSMKTVQLALVDAGFQGAYVERKPPSNEVHPNGLLAWRVPRTSRMVAEEIMRIRAERPMR